MRNIIILIISVSVVSMILISFGPGNRVFASILFQPSTVASPTPTPTPDPSATPTPTPDPSATPTPTADPSATPTPSPSPTPDPKTDMCHIPPGNPPNYHTINISTSAVNAHLGHGDIMGSCDDVDPNDLPT